MITSRLAAAVGNLRVSAAGIFRYRNEELPELAATAG
jgi:hypothetical protein